VELISVDHCYFLNCLCGSDERLIKRHYANTILTCGLLLSYPILDLCYVNLYYNNTLQHVKNMPLPLAALSKT